MSPTFSAVVRPGRRPRLLFVNRSYWPDVESTGQHLTELCEDLSEQFEVTVIAGQPNHNPAEARFRTRGVELRHGVRICRIGHSRFSKRFLPGRAVNQLSFLAGAAWAAWSLPRPDVVVVQSDPPWLCFLGALLQRGCRARLILNLQDLYPDVAIALGKVPNSRLVQTLRAAMARTYRRADRIFVPGRNMQTHLTSFGVAPDRVRCIPNWVDLAQIHPCPEANAFRSRHGLDGRFVVMYSGNLGLCQPLGEVLRAAALLQERTDILFLFIGDGAQRASLEKMAQERRLTNVRFLPYQPKSELAQSLGAANLHLVPIDSRVVSFVMPSKIYDILASGSPSLVVAPEQCELAELVREGEVGRVVPPGDPVALAEAIRQCADAPATLAAMGARARELAVQYGRQRWTTQVAEELAEVLEFPRREAVCV